MRETKLMDFLIKASGMHAPLQQACRTIGPILRLLISLTISLLFLSSIRFLFSLKNFQALALDLKKFDIPGMEFFFGNMDDVSSKFNREIARCPFLTNSNKPTNLSFSASVASQTPLQDRRGPIFEDEFSFHMAFKLYHGQNGVVPLSESSVPETSPAQFNSLAAKEATISLPGFGFGGPYGFDALHKRWKKKHKGLNSSRKESRSEGMTSDHEATTNEWLQNGDCPIAKSYRAVSRVLPLVGKVLRSPPGMKIRCPPVVIAARSALAKTAFARNLRPRPLPNKILIIGTLGMAANIPLGIWREHTKKFSASWFAAVHAAVPFIAMLRKSVLMPKAAMAFTIGASILGQLIGSRA